LTNADWIVPLFYILAALAMGVATYYSMKWRDEFLSEDC
jgi:hypothetical protein